MNQEATSALVGEAVGSIYGEDLALPEAQITEGILGFPNCSESEAARVSSESRTLLAPLGRQVISYQKANPPLRQRLAPPDYAKTRAKKAQTKPRSARSERFWYA